MSCVLVRIMMPNAVMSPSMEFQSPMLKLLLTAYWYIQRDPQSTDHKLLSKMLYSDTIYILATSGPVGTVMGNHFGMQPATQANSASYP